MPRALEVVNRRWHVWGLVLLCLWVIAHWVEHLAQLFEVLFLGEHRAHAHGAIGALWPILVTSEWLHFSYVAITFLGLALLLAGFTGEARWWWKVTVLVGGWHVIEHALLLSQALTGYTLFGRPEPVSLLQLVIPRLELHLVYNAAMTVPMVMALLKYVWQPGESEMTHGQERSVSSMVSR